MTLGTNPKDILGVAKVSISKIPASALIHEANAMADGARKYGPFNWRKNKVIASIYVDAALRHISSWFDGEELAEDSGVHHLGHARACLAIIIDAMETGNLVDDRPVPGVTSALIKKFSTRTNSAFATSTVVGSLSPGQSVANAIQNENKKV